MFKTVKISHNLLEKTKINIFSYKLVDKFLSKNLYQDELMLQVSTLVRNYKKLLKHSTIIGYLSYKLQSSIYYIIT